METPVCWPDPFAWTLGLRTAKQGLSNFFCGCCTSRCELRVAICGGGIYMTDETTEKAPTLLLQLWDVLWGNKWKPSSKSAWVAQRGRVPNIWGSWSIFEVPGPGNYRFLFWTRNVKYWVLAPSELGMKCGQMPVKIISVCQTSRFPCMGASRLSGARRETTEKRVLMWTST